MKLSEVLKKDWPEKLEWFYPELSGPNEFEKRLGQAKIDSANDMLTSCDREIDREALAKVIYSLMDFITKWEDVGYEEKQVYLSEADTIISTMPTWLKPTERK